MNDFRRNSARILTSPKDPKLREIVHQDLWTYEAIEANLSLP
jgi:hypothetical protein